MRLTMMAVGGVMLVASTRLSSMDPDAAVMLSLWGAAIFLGAAAFTE